MSEVYRKLKELEGKNDHSAKRNSMVQESVPKQRDGEVGEFRDEADQLRQTISSLESEWEAVDQERADLSAQLQESRSSLEVLSQEADAREKRLEEIDRSHQSLVEDLRAEIQEKAGRIVSLEEQIENLTGGHRQKVELMEQQMADRGREVESLRTELDQLRQTVSTFEANWEAYHQERADLKGQMLEWRSRLQILSRKVATRDTNVGKL
jgi:chromosome segregation ATPase